MGLVYAVPTTVGGTVLVIERIESSNYVTQVSGWMIAADGTAEFFNIIIRGSFVTGPPGSRHIEIRDSPGNQIEFYTGEATETDPGVIDVNYDVGTDSATLLLVSPELAGAFAAQFALTSDAAAGISRAIIDAIETQITGTLSAQGAVTFGSSLAVQGAVTFSTYPRARTSPALSGAWAAVGQAPGCNLSVDGMTHLSGIATGGVLGSQIFVLPLAMRPNAQKTFPVNANGAYGSLRVDVSGAVVFTAGSTTNVSISGVNFPTF